MMKHMMITVALAAIGMLTTSPAWADIPWPDSWNGDNKFSVENKVIIQPECKHDCSFKGDINQKGTIDYSESHGGHDVTDVLNFYGKHLHGHKITFEVTNLDTGAHLSYDQSGYDEYTTIFHWYDGKFPLGSTYTACLHDHKTDDQSCKTKSHQENPDEITVDND